MKRSRGQPRQNRLTVIGAIITIILVIVVIMGPWIKPYDPLSQDLSLRLTGPTLGSKGTPAHLLGTDQLGRDVLSRIIYAARVTVTIAVISVLVSACVGTMLGIGSGYYGGMADNIIMRIADIQLAFPTILLALTIVAVLGSSVVNLVLVFVITGWVGYVRVIRAQVLVLKELEFVEAARAIGCSSRRVLFRHLLPNVLTEAIILSNIQIGRVILLESALSYLGLGVQPPLPTWGNMLSEARLYIQDAWWAVTFPGLAIIFTVLGTNLLSEGLRGLYTHGA